MCKHCWHAKLNFCATWCAETHELNLLKKHLKSSVAYTGCGTTSRSIAMSGGRPAVYKSRPIVEEATRAGEPDGAARLPLRRDVNPTVTGVSLAETASAWGANKARRMGLLAVPLQAYAANSATKPATLRAHRRPGGTLWHPR